MYRYIVPEYYNNLDIKTREAIRDLAEADYSVGHIFSPDDIDTFIYLLGSEVDISGYDPEELFDCYLDYAGDNDFRNEE